MVHFVRDAPRGSQDLAALSGHGWLPGRLYKDWLHGALALPLVRVAALRAVGAVDGL